MDSTVTTDGIESLVTMGLRSVPFLRFLPALFPLVASFELTALLAICFALMIAALFISSPFIVYL